MKENGDEDMNKERNSVGIKILAAAAYLIMLSVNIIANVLPLGGIGTDEVSDAYPNLFAPEPLTFMIWGVIYFLLAIYSLYQFGLFRGFDEAPPKKLIRKTSLLFAISSFFNCTWVFAWHYRIIWASLVLITGVFVPLMLMALEFKMHKFTLRQEILMRLPFSVYFGWMTIALTANIVTFLVSVSWGGFGLTESFWMITVIVLGALIGGAAIISYKDFAYGLVIIWAYSGILIKHLSTNGFDGNFTGIIIATAVCIAALTTVNIAVLFRQLENR